MGKGSKTENSRLNLFYILQILAVHTDGDHPLGAARIAELVNKEFGYISYTGSVVSADTVKRILDELVEKVFAVGADPEQTTKKYGYCVNCVEKTADGYVSCRPAEGKRISKKYYYYESCLKKAELLTLKDAIETYSYFSEEDITEIVGKLIRLRPLSFPGRKYFDVSGDERAEDSLLLMNIDSLIRIIENHHCARITYCAYNAEKKLVPRDGYPKVVEPLHLMWSNGYYYLLAYNEKYRNIVNFRVDRIIDIVEVGIDVHSQRVESFNLVQYRHEHPVMFGGEKETVMLLCRDTGKNYIMNTIMDVFGKKARVSPAPDELLQRVLGRSTAEYGREGITWLKVVVKSAVRGVELWATQYCMDCVIVSPSESAKRVAERLEEGQKNYLSYKNFLKN